MGSAKFGLRVLYFEDFRFRAKLIGWELESF